MINPKKLHHLNDVEGGPQNGHQALFDHPVHLHGGYFGLITNFTKVMNYGKDRLN